MSTHPASPSKHKTDAPQASTLTEDGLQKDDLKKTNLYLVGMMGVGKTTIGRKLAKRLNYRFLDTDDLIVQATGRPINQIFAEDGEVAFREIETQVLSQISTYTEFVVATGGGIVTQKMNWSYLHHGLVIWLDVPVHILVSRLTNDTARPLLKDADLEAKLTTLLDDRRKLYAQADIHIPYQGRSVSKTCDRILAAIKSNIRPDPKQAADSIQINQTNINPPLPKP